VGPRPGSDSKPSRPAGFRHSVSNLGSLQALPLVQGLRNSLSELVVCISHSWGGLEQVAAADALDRAALGLKVRVLCLEGSPLHENLARHPEVQSVPLNFRPRDLLDLKLRNELYRHFEEGVNLIHCHQTSLLASITPWLWSRPKISVFASRHILNNHSKKDFFHRAIYRRLDGLIVMSQTLRRNVLETHSLEEKQVKVVNLGLDFELFSPDKVDSAAQRARWGIPNADILTIGLVGRIDPAKGQGVFIKAAAGLLKNREYEGRLKFVMVGEETLGKASTHLEELKFMVRQFRLDDQVIFAGYQENIPEVMGAFDILVMPSRQEAFGLVAIEAMAMGKPIIISQGGSAAEIVGDQDFGLLVRPDNAFDLQRLLKKLIDDGPLRSSMGEKGLAHVRAHYDRKVRVQRTLELYERALRKRRTF